MSAAWFGVLGSLLGVLVGVAVGHWLQRTTAKREAVSQFAAEVALLVSKIVAILESSSGGAYSTGHQKQYSEHRYRLDIMLDKETASHKKVLDAMDDLLEAYQGRADQSVAQDKLLAATRALRTA